MDISDILRENYGRKPVESFLDCPFEILHLPSDLSAKARYTSSATDIHTLTSYRLDSKTAIEVQQENSIRHATPLSMHRQPERSSKIVIGDSKDNVHSLLKMRPPTASTNEVDTTLKSMVHGSDARVSRIYSLRIRQQPIAARAWGFGERLRRVVDPPPILEMQVEDPQASPQELASYLRSPYCVVHCTIWDAVNDCDDSAMPGTIDRRQQRRLMGTLVASPFVGNDEVGIGGCFFVFPDLSVRTPGIYRLRFQLVVLDPVMASGVRTPVRSIIKSDVFQVFNAKDFRGMRASTALTKSLRLQGCLIFVEKSPAKEARELEGDGSDDNCERERNVSPKKAPAETYLRKASPAPEDGPFALNEQPLDRGQPPQNGRSRRVNSKGENNLRVVKSPSTMTSEDALCVMRDSVLPKASQGQGISHNSAIGPAKRKMISGIMNDFWAIFDEQWSARILQHSGSTSELSSDALVQSSNEEWRGGKLKRSRDDGEAGSDECADDGDGGSRRRRIESNLPINPSHSTGFGCPYRKHNPRKYNHEDRQWRSCALSPLSDVSRVKGHLYRHHRIYQCERCGEVLSKESLLKSHFLAVNPCELKPFSVVDGVTCSIEKKLKSRKKIAQNQSQADRWKEMYRVLFPEVSVEAVPSPYFEPIRDESSVDTADSFDLTTFEAFSRAELPAIFEAALEVAFSANPDALEGHLRAQLVAMVQESQDQLITEYRSRTLGQIAVSQHVADEPAAPVAPGARPARTSSSVELCRPPRQYKPARQRRKEKLQLRREPRIDYADSPTLETRQHRQEESVSARELPISNLGNWSSVDIPSIDSFFNFNGQPDYQPATDFQYQATYPTFENASSSGIVGHTPFNEMFHFPGQIPSQTESPQDQEARTFDFQTPVP